MGHSLSVSRCQLHFHLFVLGGERSHLFVRQLFVWQLTWGAGRAPKNNTRVSCLPRPLWAGVGVGRSPWGRLAWDAGPLDTAGCR